MNHKLEMKNLFVIDLFAGCGGMGLGLNQAGFKTAFVNELNPDALGSYVGNRKDSEPHLADPDHHSNDIKEFVSDPAKIHRLLATLRSAFGLQLGEVDLVAGGPPCQGYSGIGHRRSYSVEKEQLPSNHLYEDMAFFISKVRPKAFMFENVRGLLNARWNASGKKGEIFAAVLAAFASIPGYTVAYDLVFAKDYGVPQNRPRVLLVGLRDDLAFGGKYKLVGDRDAVERGFLPKPPGTLPPTIPELLGDLEDPLFENGGATSKYPHAAKLDIQKQFRKSHDGCSVSRKGAAVTEHEYSHHSPRVVDKFKAMLARPDHSIPEEFRTKKFAQRVLPRVWGPDGPNITAASLSDDYVHYSQPRSLTVREWARLQMFPDWYQFEGKRTTGGLRRAGNPREGLFDRELPKYTQIGNAVPVELAFQVGTHLARIIRAK